MSALLVRGLSLRDRRDIQKIATTRNMSMNQWLIDLIHSELRRTKTEEEKEAESKEAFRRIRELAAEVSAKYGKQQDSTEIIRHFRDTRNQ